MSKLFHPFSQGDASTTRKYGGSGLGLSISKQLTEMMDGEIWVESQFGRGSCFVFTANFGLSDELGAGQQLLKHDIYGLDVVADIRGAHILLVEDNEVNQRVAIDLLERVQLVVTVARNGQEAVDLVRETYPVFDCILMDVQMPVMDGYEATRLIRQDERFKDLPIVAMTANVMPSDQKKTQEAGMNDYVAKPIDPKNMYATLARWVKSCNSGVPDELMPPQGVSDGTAAPLNLPGFEMDQALARVGGSIKAYRNILGKVYEAESDLMVRIRKSLEVGDRQAAVRLAHTVKGLAGTIGAIALQSVLGELETQLRQTDVEPSEALMAAAGAKLKQTMVTIEFALQDDINPQHAATAATAIAIDMAEVLSSLGEQIGNFDSTTEETVEELLARVDDPDLRKSFVLLKRHLSEYDFIAAAVVLDGISEHCL